MAIREEKLNSAIGSDDDFFEVVPGYLDSFKQAQIKKEQEKEWKLAVKFD